MTIAEQLASPEGNSLGSENIPKIPRTAAAFQQIDGEPSTDSLGDRLRALSRLSVGEIDSLISELQTLRRKLQTDGERIQQDIREYAELNQQVIQLTSIISDTVKKLPGANLNKR